MIEVSSLSSPEITEALLSGGIGVVRTDTLYGIIARAEDERAVERVYALKHRNPQKSPIVLISDVSQMYDSFPASYQPIIGERWPAKTTMIFPSIEAPLWLRRDNGSVAYRLPHHAELRALIEKTGPLIAPSANPEGLTPAMTIAEAKAYFGDAVDFYVDGGTVTDDSPSRIIRFADNGDVEELR